MMSEEIDLEETPRKDPHHNNKVSDDRKRLSSSAGEIVIQPGSVHSLDPSISKKVPKRRIHFSDGVIEEYSSSEDEEEKDPPTPDASPMSTESPKDMPWIPWMLYYVSFSGCSTLRVAESLGDKLGWFFGVTSPKYYYEIEEFKRTKKQEEVDKSKEKSLNWNGDHSTNPSGQAVITLDPKKLPSSEFTELCLDEEKKKEDSSLNV